jgi:hypothetical protein
VIGAGLALFTLTGTSGDYLTEILPGVAVFGRGAARTHRPPKRCARRWKSQPGSFQIIQNL